MEVTLVVVEPITEMDGKMDKTSGRRCCCCFGAAGELIVAVGAVAVGEVLCPLMWQSRVETTGKI